MNNKLSIISDLFFLIISLILFLISIFIVKSKQIIILSILGLVIWVICFIIDIRRINNSEDSYKNLNNQEAK